MQLEMTSMRDKKLTREELVIADAVCINATFVFVMYNVSNAICHISEDYK